LQWNWIRNKTSQKSRSYTLFTFRPTQSPQSLAGPGSTVFVSRWNHLTPRRALCRRHRRVVYWWRCRCRRWLIWLVESESVARCSRWDDILSRLNMRFRTRRVPSLSLLLLAIALFGSHGAIGILERAGWFLSLVTWLLFALVMCQAVLETAVVTAIPNLSAASSQLDRCTTASATVRRTCSFTHDDQNARCICHLLWRRINHCGVGANAQQITVKFSSWLLRLRKFPTSRFGHAWQLLKPWIGLHALTARTPLIR